MRYTWEPGQVENKISGFGHQFPASFLRSSFDVSTAPAELTPREVSEFILKGIEQEIKRTGAKTIVIDSLDRFNGVGLIRSRDIAFVMGRLRRLKAEHGLSILVLMHLPRRNPNHPLSAGNLLSTRMACAFADSAFALGQCRWDERVRYVKHLTSRSAEIVFDSEYVPAFTVCRDEGVFLSFLHDNFYPESALLDPYLNRRRLEQSDRIKEMAAGGSTQREIALNQSMSLGAVNRALSMWSPYDDRPKAPPPSPPTPVRKPRSRPTKTAKTVEQTSKNGHSVRDASGFVGSPRVSKGATQLESNTAPSLTVGLPTHVSTSPPENAGPLEASGLEHSFDEHGNQIWIEKRREYDGRPHIYYLYKSNGNISRCVRDDWGIIGRTILRDEFKLEKRDEG